MEGTATAASAVPCYASAVRGALQGPLKDVYQAALGLGTANQLTNILRDVGEDATERDRIYVPTQELKEFGISEPEVRCCALSRLWLFTG